MSESIFDASASFQPESFSADPPTKSAPSLADFVAQEKAAPAYQHELSSSTTNAEKVNRYRNSRIFSQDLNPDGDNEHYAAQNQTVWDAMGSGWEGFKDNFKDSFKEGVYTWARLGKAIMNFDLSEFTPDEFELETAAATERERMSKNAIYNDPYTDSDDGIFTRQFAAESLQNLGFTVGTMAELGLEYGIETGVGALLALPTGGGSLVASQAAGVASASTKMGKMLEKMTALMQKAFRVTSKAGDDALRMGAGALEGEATVLRANKYRLLAEEAARHNKGIAASLKTGKFMDAALNVAERLPFAGELVSTGRLIKGGARIGLEGKDLVKIGRGGVRRAFGEWQMASSEAAIEAGSNYGSTYDKMYGDYVAKHGEDPSVEEQMRMRTLAQQSAMADFATNVVVLGMMNKLQFGNLFSKFLPDAAMARAFKGEVERGFIVSGMNKAGTQELTKAYGKPFLGRIGILPQVYKDFGRKTAGWQAAKALGAGLGRFEVAEGVQELIQEGSASGITDYYSDLYSTGKASIEDSLGKAVESQANYQGVKTFVSGVLTGVPLHGATKVGERAIEALGYQKKQAQAARQADQESIAELNNFFQNPLYREETLGEYVKSIKKQTAANQNMAEAAANGDRYTYENNRSSALSNMVMHAKRMGTFDGMLEYISGHMDGMTPEDFEQAYGYKISESGFDSPQAFARNVSEKLKRYNEVYEKNLEKFDRYFRLADFVSDTHRAERMQYTRAALMDAIETVAFQEMQVQDTTQRAAQIMSNISRFPTLGSSLSSSFHTLTDHENFDETLRILANEITSLESINSLGGDPKAKQLLQDKEEEYVALQSWMISMGFEEFRDENTTTISFKADEMLKNPEQRKEAVRSLYEYLTIKNRQAGIRTKVSEKEVDEALGDLVDFLKLTGQQHEHINALNALSDPETFMNTTAKLADARLGAYARSLADFYRTQQEQTQDQELKTILDANEDKLAELEAFATNPYHSTKNYERITDFHDNLKKALQSLKDQKDTASQSVPSQVPNSVPSAVPSGVSTPVSPAVPAQVSSPVLFSVQNTPIEVGDVVSFKGTNYRIESAGENEQGIPVVFIRRQELWNEPDSTTAPNNKMQIGKFTEHFLSGALTHQKAAAFVTSQSNPTIQASTQETPMVEGMLDIGQGILDANGKIRKDIKKAIDALYRESSGADANWIRKEGKVTTHDELGFKGLPDFGGEVPLNDNERYLFFAKFENKLVAEKAAKAEPAVQTVGEVASADEQIIVDVKEQLANFVNSRVSMLQQGRVVEGVLHQSSKPENGYYFIRDDKGADLILADSTATSKLSDFEITPIETLPVEVLEETAPTSQLLLTVNDQPVTLQFVSLQGPNSVNIILNGQPFRFHVNKNGFGLLFAYNEQGEYINYYGGIYNDYVNALLKLPYFQNAIADEEALNEYFALNRNLFEHQQAVSQEVLDELVGSDVYLQIVNQLPTATAKSFTSEQLQEGVDAVLSAIRKLRNFAYTEFNENLLKEFHRTLTSIQRLQHQQQHSTQQVTEEVQPSSQTVTVPAFSRVDPVVQTPVERTADIDDVTGEVTIPGSLSLGDRRIVIKNGELSRVYIIDNDRRYEKPIEQEDKDDVERYLKLEQKRKEQNEQIALLEKDGSFEPTMQYLISRFGSPADFEALAKVFKNPLHAVRLIDFYTKSSSDLVLSGEQLQEVLEQSKKLQKEDVTLSDVVVTSTETNKPHHEPVTPTRNSRRVSGRKKAESQAVLPESAATNRAETGDSRQSAEPVSQPEPQPTGSTVENRRGKQSGKVKAARSQSNQSQLDGLETVRNFSNFDRNSFLSEVQKGLEEILAMPEVQKPVKNYDKAQRQQPATNPFEELVGRLACHR